MGRLFWQISASLDGYVAGPSGELHFTSGFIDADFERYALEMLNAIDAILLGRKTYQLFVDYWPTSTGPDADRINALPKIVFSRTLEEVDWHNARLASASVAEEIPRLKRQFSGDIALFGSAGLAATLIRLGLIDEYRIFLTPFVLGAGSRMFDDITGRIDLRLTKANTWSTGTVALHYEPVSGAR